MLLLGFNYDLWHFLLLFQFPSATKSGAKSEKQPNTNPAPQTYPLLVTKNRHKKQTKKKTVRKEEKTFPV